MVDAERRGKGREVEEEGVLACLTTLPATWCCTSRAAQCTFC